MTGYVDKEAIADDHEQLTDDDTIGRLIDEDGELEADICLHMGRLRRALLAFEEETHPSRPTTVDVGVHETEDGLKLLSFQHGKNTIEVILLAGRNRREDDK